MIDDTVRAYVVGADLGRVRPRTRYLRPALDQPQEASYPVGVTVDEVEEEAGGERNWIDTEFLAVRMVQDAHEAYERREEEFGEDGHPRAGAHVAPLQVIDRKWREHLYEMDYLRDGVSLRAYAQRDPWLSTSARASRCSTRCSKGRGGDRRFPLQLPAGAGAGDRGGRRADADAEEPEHEYPAASAGVALLGAQHRRRGRQRQRGAAPRAGAGRAGRREWATVLAASPTVAAAACLPEAPVPGP